MGRTLRGSQRDKRTKKLLREQRRKRKAKRNYDTGAVTMDRRDVRGREF